MFVNTTILLQTYLLRGRNVAPAPAPVAAPVLDGDLTFSGTKFLVALLAGVLMAFAFQLLLTNFSIAAGISSGAEVADDDTDTIGKQIRLVEAKIGAWALVTSSIALFAASFLAVKLSLIESALYGAILGVVIWSTYFTVVTWIGSQAVGSLLGSVISTVTSSLQGLMGAATGVVGANVARQQTISTVEDITAAVRRELTSGLDPEGLTNSLRNSIATLQLPRLDLKDIRSQFDRLLKDVDVQSLADSDVLSNINRQTFVDLISSRSDFSKEEVEQIADQLEGAWKQVSNRKNPTDQVINLLKQATPEQLKSENLGEQLQKLVTVGGSNGQKGNGLMQQAIQYGLGAAATGVLDRVNLSDVDVQKITEQLQTLKEKVQEVDIDKITLQLKQLSTKATQQVTESLPGQPQGALQSDVEDYLLKSFHWHFNPITVQNEFYEVLLDRDAAPSNMRRQLEGLSQEKFVGLLERRGDLSQERIQEISEQLERIRQDVLQMVRDAQGSEQKEDLRNRLENYLRSTGKEELNPDAIERDLSSLLEDPNASIEDLQNRFSQFDRDTLVQLLGQRDDISQEEANNIVSQLERTRDNILNRARELQEQAKTRANELRQRVEDYLRNTNKEELNPDAIERELGMIFEDPQAGFAALRDRLSQFDRDTLVAFLSQRQDLSEEQVNQIIDRALSVRDRILQAPQQVADTAKQRYEETTKAIAQYLRDTNLEELDPQGIQRDLETLLSDPKEGALALRDRLSQVDRETLVTLLTQRGDLSEEDVNRLIDRVQSAIDNIVKAPRRLANRTVQRVSDFEATLENYLRNTNKEELNPEAIKRDLQLLLQDPRSGVSSLGDRISKFDRSTMVALLSQREDISEEEANQIVDRIESTRDGIVQQYEQVKQRVQSAIDGIFGNVRTYLNSLDRPELNYEGIQQDFATLFDDPQAGFEALRDRLSQFDRDTLVALISSREDISEEEANRIVDRIEAARDSVLSRTERIQQEVSKRLNAIKEQAKKEAIQTKKIVADAAWWLVRTAFVSLAASAIAGVLAVTGFSWIS
ncbi:MFS transporter [Candidatus Gracilibacteria bacterium]|nr:MFS transporter [Candidatus Gracilibacteria bacterium]NJM88277.1 MFS transporter [Hydrococcus sp. RU_2_2]NJP19245.1 MFS transporter [Hydrococcus sp. CRU_1_1]